MIVTYNKEQVGDVLMLTLKNSGEAKLAVERKGKVARVYREDNQETVAWNIFDASSFFPDIHHLILQTAHESILFRGTHPGQ